MENRARSEPRVHVAGPYRRGLGDRLEQCQPFVEEPPGCRGRHLHLTTELLYGRRRGDCCNRATRGGCRRTPRRGRSRSPSGTSAGPGRSSGDPRDSASGPVTPDVRPSCRLARAGRFVPPLQMTEQGRHLQHTTDDGVDGAELKTRTGRLTGDHQGVQARRVEERDMAQVDDDRPTARPAASSSSSESTPLEVMSISPVMSTCTSLPSTRRAILTGGACRRPHRAPSPSPVPPRLAVCGRTTSQIPPPDTDRDLRRHPGHQLSERRLRDGWRGGPGRARCRSAAPTPRPRRRSPTRCCRV